MSSQLAASEARAVTAWWHIKEQQKNGVFWS